MGQMPLLLLVDDDAQLLEVLSVKLASEGFRIETAQSGTEAIEKARRAVPDLVVIDMKMPGMDGAETLHAMHADPALQNVKAVFLSGIIAADEEQFKIDRNFAIAEGALGCLRKTDDLDHIVKMLREFDGASSSPSATPPVPADAAASVPPKPAPPANGGAFPAHHG